MDYIAQVAQLKDKIVAHRRYIHHNAEAGLNLPTTAKYVMEKLTDLGLTPDQPSQGGVVAVIEGKHPGKTILLRADMDGLPMSELNNLPFKSKTAFAHTCGHDLHAAMLLGAAELLMKNRDELAGNIKLVFQSGEESFEGAKSLVDAGVLAAPPVDAAMALHVTLDHHPGTIQYCYGFTTFSRDSFKIIVTGKGCHGDTPEQGIDPINVGAHIYLAFQELIARETPSLEPAVLTFGQFSSGSTCNIIPETALLQGTLCTYDTHLRSRLMARMRQIAELTARSYGATVQFEVFSSVPAVYTEPTMLGEMLGYIDDMSQPVHKEGNKRISSSEDFAFITERVPSVYLHVGAKMTGNDYPPHNPLVMFSEDALPLGAAVFAQCAHRWLEANQ